MASLRLLLLLLLAQRGLGAAAGRGRAPGGRQPIYNHIKSRDPPPAPRSRSPESTILAQRLAEEVPQDVASFLYTGDSRELRRANCSGRYELASLAGKSRFVSHPSLHGALDTLTHATNFLNMILQSNKSREQNLQEDLEWYRALIRSLLEGDPNISRAAITFSTEPFSAPQVFLQASRHESQIHLQDLSSSAHRLANGSLETEWFQGLKRKWRPHQHRKVLNTGSKTLENSWKRREGFTADKNHIRWSSPYLECENGNYKPGWLVTLSAAFYGLQPNLIPEFRGVVKVDINLQKVDIDQCSSEGWFSGTHRCHLNNSECLPIKGLGFVLGAYKCICKEGFYHPNIFSVNSFQRKDADNRFSGGDLSEEVYTCLPCREGCSNCKDDTPCYAQEDKYLRLAIISFQTLCMLLDFISMLVVYHFRKAKSIRASGLVLLETILFGSLLLYFPVVILYFEPSVFRCVLLRWVRLLGFATVYGTVTLKLHRFILASRLQSDWMLMLFFAHTHLTVTVTVGLLLIPKFSHSSNNPRDDIATEAYEDELDMGRSGSYLNSSINSAWSEHSLDPEDIRDELKKLYAQLEIYKRKKMIANNPHLQKKRCSKKGLGRSIMRRITEIPETVTRQCSRDEKDLMEHSAVKNTATLKKTPQDSTSSVKPKEETLKNRVFSLKKSHSTYDHVRDQTGEPNSITTESTEVTAAENSLLDSLTGNNLTKKAEKAEAVSTESVPLVCKSLSAHNLSADKKPLHPRTSVLQKSLSVIASAKEKTLGLTGKTQSLEESAKSQKSQQKGKEGSKKHSAADKGEHKDSHRKNSTQSEETKKTHKSGIMKQQRVSQTPANPDTGPGKSLHKDTFDIGEVCPWEIYDQTPGPVPSDSKIQKHVSIASSEAEKNHPSQPKGKSHHKQKTPEGYQQSNQQSPQKLEAGTREVQEQHIFENDKKQLNSKPQGSPGLKRENVNRYAPNVCGGEREELPQKAAENVSKLVEQKKVASSEGNVLSDSRKPSGYSQQPLASRAEVCPWEFDTPDLPNAERSVALSNTSAISANKTATPRK
ncbi:probable G-protein coupled receptor 158 isoform X1 [Gallus gallus]|uniref:probable G-protein coupled receptor 158 isoform X1 n=1 Tax=Gallus gallus TaxID=9031 RepID=UPI001AE337C4|nr:probable G-protein coupled receptor 158 isoform X1 [Gallus gallus]